MLFKWSSIAVLGLTSFFTIHSWAWETDQFSSRLTPVRDSTLVLNKKVNQAIDLIVEKWGPNDGESPATFAYRLQKKLVNAFTTGRYEHWLNTSRYVDRLTLTETIYSDASVLAQRFGIFVGVSPTIMVNGIRLGTDKPGHFFSEGYSYYSIAHEQKMGEIEAIMFGIHTEYTYFGKWISAVYSNADLVANYEGYRFYRSLFEDNIVNGKKAVLKWVAGYPVVQRDFDWADHISEFWDEALNPSMFSNRLQHYVLKKLRTYCDEYWQAPQSFAPSREDELKKKYWFVGLQDNTAARMDHVCLGG